MGILLMLRALRRNKLGATLIALQIALTLAIVSNCVFIIREYVLHMQQPTGIDEANIFTFSNAYVVDDGHSDARIQADLAALRGLPGVIDVEATDTYPLLGYGWGWGLRVRSDQQYSTAGANRYYVDDHALNAYGLNLVAGRWFTAQEVRPTTLNDSYGAFPSVIVVTRKLAQQLFPSGGALGQIVYFTPQKPARIVGIVDRVQTPYTTGYQNDNSSFEPLQFVDNQISYIVRTQPGQLAHVMQTAPQRLYELTRERVIQDLRPFSATRRQAYLEERVNTVMLAVVCGLLLAVTAFGVIGLTLYWVAQRRRQIGMRRALGARRLDILRYFQTENLLIAGTGCLVGIGLGLALNTWLLTKVDGLTRMSPAYICSGALLVLVLCQAAVLWPALRAAAIAPAIATRGL
jgi:putative ABC transport system permease protein